MSATCENKVLEDANWQETRNWQLRLSLKATPLQRLEWLEEILVLTQEARVRVPKKT